MTGPLSRPSPIEETAQRVLLDVKRYTTSRYVSEAVSESMTVDYYRHTLDRMALDLSMKVLGKDLPPDVDTVTKTVRFEVPASWWQQWKAEHLGSRLWGWLAGRRPVLTRAVAQDVTLTARWTRTLTLPQADIALADRLGGGAVAVDLLDEVRFTPWRVEP